MAVAGQQDVISELREIKTLLQNGAGGGDLQISQLASLLGNLQQNTMESGNYQSLSIDHIEVSERKFTSPLLQMAVKHLVENPADMKVPNRQLASLLGISHPWVGKAKNLIRTGEYADYLQ